MYVHQFAYLQSANVLVNAALREKLMARNYTGVDSADCAGCPEYKQVLMRGVGKEEGKKLPRKEW